jgi:hypothetical protein
MTNNLAFTDDKGTRHLFSSIESRDSFIAANPHLARFVGRGAVPDGTVIKVPTMIMDSAPPSGPGEVRMAFRERVQMVTDTSDDARATEAAAYRRSVERLNDSRTVSAPSPVTRQSHVLTDAEIAAGRTAEADALARANAALNGWRK